MAFGEVDSLLLTLYDFHKGVRDVLFTQRFGLLLDALRFVSHLQNERSVSVGFAGHRVLKIPISRHLVLLCNLRLLIRIVEFHRNLVVPRFEEIQQVAGRSIVAARVEGLDLKIVLQLGRHVGGLFRKAVYLFRRHIDTFHMLGPKVVHQPQNS